MDIKELGFVLIFQEIHEARFTNGLENSKSRFLSHTFVRQSKLCREELEKEEKKFIN